MGDREIYIAIALAAAVLGASLILYLLRIVANIFSAFGGRGYYDPHINDRERNNGGGCFLPFFLFLVIVIIGGKMVYDRFNKPNEGNNTYISPKWPEFYGNRQPEVIMPVNDPATPLKTLDEDEIPFEDEIQRSKAPITEKAILPSSNPCNAPYIIQAGFFLDYKNAEKRMAELSEEFNGKVGMYQKYKDGRGGYVVYIGTFCSDSEAKEIRSMHGLRGDVLPSDQLHLLLYKGN